jgi:hypothetical protein
MYSADKSNPFDTYIFLVIGTLPVMCMFGHTPTTVVPSWSFKVNGSVSLPQLLQCRTTVLYVITALDIVFGVGLLSLNSDIFMTGTSGGLGGAANRWTTLWLPHLSHSIS